jgi:RTX calcium-binding nonapeptide repeat (4 copies)
MARNEVVVIRAGTVGNDTLVGGAGDDIVVGDRGTAMCDGGAQVQGDITSAWECVTGVP